MDPYAFLHGIIRICNYLLAGAEAREDFNLAAIIPANRDALEMYGVAGIEHRDQRTFRPHQQSVAGKQEWRVFA